jgi:peptidoglycan hydrolase-like protein with peptidoglycan-binding domain
MAECFAWVKGVTSTLKGVKAYFHVDSDALVTGAVVALGFSEAIRERLRRANGGIPRRISSAVSYASSAESAPELVALARSQEAFQAQRSLAVDGNFGPESARAIQVFLTRKGMNPGKIDGVFGTKAKRAFQDFLRGRGYDVGKIDGFFGPRSVMALQRWVRERGFSPKEEKPPEIDGIWGPHTTRALQQTLNTALGASRPTLSTSPKASGSGNRSEDAPSPAESRKPRRTASERRSRRTGGDRDGASYFCS